MAAASKEAWAGGPQFSESEYGERLRSWPEESTRTFMWVIAIDNEADYSYALDQGNENPGGDVSVISDAKIQAGVQAHWPADATTPLPPDMNGPTPGEV